LKNPESIQVKSFIYTQQFIKATSKKINKEIKNVNNKQLTVKKQAPLPPINLPKNPAIKELNKGKKINSKYILNHIKYYFI